MSILTQYEIDGSWTSVATGDSFIQQIAAETNATLSIAGQSVEGNPIYALTVGTGLRRALVTSGVHGTEPASREAILMKTRDVCYNVSGDYTDYLANHTIMFIPTVNPDKMHVSYRNSANVDINRVVYYLDSPEGIAFLETLRDFQPEVFFDFHEHSGSTTSDVLYVYAMSLDANSDPTVRRVQGEVIDYVRTELELGGATTDYYFSWNTGFGSLTSGLGILGTIAFTAETKTTDLPEKRVNLQKQSFDKSLDWHKSNHATLDEVGADFTNNMLKTGDAFTLLQGMTTGAEMYTQATRQEISMPTAYQLSNVAEFQSFLDVYDITIEEGGVIPVNQRSGRMLPHLLDPEADMKVAEAVRIEPERRTGGRYTKVLYDEWREVFIKYM